MKRFIAVVFSVVLLTSFVQAQSYSKVFVFGESLLDRGNFKALMATVGKNNPPDPPYADGRFSNGKVFAEVIADNFGVGNLTASWYGGTNYAYAGARSMIDYFIAPAPPPAPKLLIPSVRHQVMNYLADAGDVADPGALYILHDGGNDSFFASSMAKAGQWDAAVALLKQSAQGIVGSVALLAEHGAVNFVVPNAPRFSITPKGCGDSLIDVLGQVYNTELQAGLAGLNGELEIVYFDLFGFETAIEDRFIAECASCLTAAGVCINPDDFLFWDQAHFTAAAHQLVGDAITLAVLKHKVIALTAAGILNPGQSNSLLSKLDVAFRKIEDRKLIPAVNLCRAFADEVNALIRAGILTSEQAELMLAGAYGIISQP
jgi:phospholipase/lecithinase/hemolysin